MDFRFSEEQTLLGDSAGRFLRDQYGLDVRRAIIASEAGYSAEIWSQLADLGWLALPFGEDVGGLEAGAVETMIIMEAFGRSLVVEPYLANVVLTGGLIEALGSDEQRQEILPAVIAGKKMLAFAYSEPDARYDLARVRVTAEKCGDGYKLDGHKSVVLNGLAADWLVVSARTGGAHDEAEGISLFLVPGDAAGVERRGYATLDSQRAAEITFSGVELGAGALLGEKDVALAPMEMAIDRATAALAADAMGAMQALNQTTVEFLMTRKQFGRPIGSFQVLQHRMTDMIMEYEQVKSLVYLATLKLDAEPDERKRAVSAAKVQVGRSGRMIGQNAVQMHGGMGVSDELNVGQYFKRLTAIDALFGNVDYHRRRFAAL